MPEEIESPVEKLSEELHEAAQHAREAWLKWSALLSALFAVLAATAGLESGRYANEAMIAQIEASDKWSYYQAKGIKAMVTEAEQNILKELDRPAAEFDQKLNKYRDEQEKIKNDAEAKVEISHKDLEKHEVLSRTVTLCQVAIAIIAIAVLTRRRSFVLLSLVFGAAGLAFLIEGFLM